MEVVQEIEFKLFQAFLNTLKKKGAVETLKILETKTREVNIEDEYLRSVVSIVCEEFSIEMEELIYDRYIRGENKYAIGFCLHYLYGYYSLGDIQKKGVFEHKDKSVLSRYRQLIDGLNPRFKADIPYIKVKDRLDKKIKELKK
jgi:hypothetical protein